MTVPEHVVDSWEVYRDRYNAIAIENGRPVIPSVQTTRDPTLIESYDGPSEQKAIEILRRFRDSYTSASTTDAPLLTMNHIPYMLSYAR